MFQGRPCKCVVGFHSYFKLYISIYIYVFFQEMGHNAVLEALMKISELEGCPHPSSRRRGWGAEIYAWLMVSHSL